MRILFAGDEHPYSEFALNETMKLAMNTWADVTLLGVGQSIANPDAIKSTDRVAELPVAKALSSYRETFLNSWTPQDSPYEGGLSQYVWVSAKNGVYEETKILTGRKKDFKAHMRPGSPAREILEESADDQSDLIVMGCPKGDKCEWFDCLAAPQQVANDSDCSVLLVKESQSINRIFACLDQGYISQESLETVNQMVTIHGASLELVGLSENGDMKKNVYTRLIEIGDYYSDRQIEINTRLLDVSDFDKVMSHDLQNDLLALWLGRKSLLSRFFSSGWVGQFVSKCPNAVLVMR